jgi:hypothetical protein
VRLEGAESCIASVDLMNRIERRIGRIIFVRTGEAVLTLDGHVRPADGPPPGWLVTFEVSDAQGKVLGRRELGMLDGSDCTVVADAAELIVDLTLDPDGLLGAGIPLEPSTQQLLDELLRGEPSELDPATLPAGTRAAPSKALTAGARPVQPKPEGAVPATTDDEVALDVAGVAMIGTLPNLAPGVALNLSISVGDGFRFELGLLAGAAQRVQAPVRSDRGQASFGHQSLALMLCAPRELLFVEVCGGAEYGRQSVSATDFDRVQPIESRELLNLLVHATVRIDLFSSFFLRASAGLIAPLLRHDYVYDSRAGDQRLFRMTPIGGRAELGLGLYI